MSVCSSALVKALEAELQTDMQAQSEAVLETLRFLSMRAQKLSVGKNLDEEERCERRIAMLSRRLQLTEADPRPITMPEFKKSEPAKEDNAAEKPEGKPADKDDKAEGKTVDESKS